MDSVKESIKISKSQIQDVYQTLKSLSDSYVKKEPDLSDAEWLSSQYRSYFPSLSEKEAMELGNATLNGVHRFNHILNEAMESAATGKSKEQWFAEKMGQELRDIEISEAGEQIHILDSALLKGNQVMIEESPVQVLNENLLIDYPQFPESSSVSRDQWNTFTLKDTLLHMGQNAALAGLHTMNQSQSFHFTSEALLEDGTDSCNSLKSLIENGDIEQVKNLLTAAIKIGIDNNKLPFLSKYASVDTIASIASNGVEYASTLSRFAAGKITFMQAMEHVGLSGVSLLYNICSVNGIRSISTALLSQIPIIGPVVGNIVGGIISVTLGRQLHEKLKQTVHKIETTVRTTIQRAWNTVKSFGQKIKNKVKNFCSWLFA